MLEHLKKYKEMYTTFSFFVVLIWTVFNFYQSYMENNSEILETLKTTKQMALKSVIWNENIPLAERTSACDIYLNSGFNSLTKKECEIIINIGAESGAFNMEVKND